MVFAAAVASTGWKKLALFGADSLSEVFSDDERFSFLSKAKHHSFDSHGLGWQIQVSPSIASQCVRPFRPSDLSFDISAVRSIFDCWRTMRSEYAAIFLECGAKSHHKINQDI
jgi:hypothetical protein